MTTAERIRKHPACDELETTPDIFVNLKRGWRLGSDPVRPTHSFGEDTLREALITIRDTVKCACPDCAVQA